MNWISIGLQQVGAPEDVIEASLDASIDNVAFGAVCDWIEENNMKTCPFEIGYKIFVNTVTLYYVGEVEEIGFGWIRLKDASWVHWTGRLSLLLASGDLTKTHGSRKPRTEYVDKVGLFISTAGVSWYPWKGKLPKESIS